MTLEEQVVKNMEDLQAARNKLYSLLKENEDINHTPPIVSLTYAIGAVDMSLTNLKICLSQLEGERK